MLNRFSLKGICSLSFYELCLLGFLIAGDLAFGQRACQVVIGRRLTLNRFLWIAQQALLDACAEATNHAGMGNYKSDPPQLIMKATD